MFSPCFETCIVPDDLPEVVAKIDRTFYGILHILFLMRAKSLFRWSKNKSQQTLGLIDLFENCFQISSKYINKNNKIEFFVGLYWYRNKFQLRVHWYQGEVLHASWKHHLPNSGLLILSHFCKRKLWNNGICSKQRHTMHRSLLLLICPQFSGLRPHYILVLKTL